MRAGRNFEKKISYIFKRFIYFYFWWSKKNWKIFFTFDEKKYWKINLLLWEIYIFVYIWHKENFQILPHGLCWLKHYAANLYQSRRQTSDNWSLNKSKLGVFYPKNKNKRMTISASLMAVGFVDTDEAIFDRPIFRKGPHRHRSLVYANEKAEIILHCLLYLFIFSSSCSILRVSWWSATNFADLLQFETLPFGIAAEHFHAFLNVGIRLHEKVVQWASESKFYILPQKNNNKRNQSFNIDIWALQVARKIKK